MAKECYEIDETGDGRCREGNCLEAADTIKDPTDPHACIANTQSRIIPLK